MLQFDYKFKISSRISGSGGGMFGSDDQNQNSDVQATPAADVMASAPSAPTLTDPMVTPSAQPDLSADLSAEALAKAGASAKVEAGINDASMQNAYTEPAAQIGPAKPSTDNQDLAQIKQQALQSLEPLVGQLDQAPDEKFKTVMMLIQASDNSKMLKEAYEAASQITDEKARAQALLDIVNEINYFTAQAQAKQ